jgi:hypothetical protein
VESLVTVGEVSVEGDRVTLGAHSAITGRRLS